jgi:hypothetical protein
VVDPGKRYRGQSASCAFAVAIHRAARAKVRPQSVLKMTGPTKNPEPTRDSNPGPLYYECHGMP